jgi:hypothetical protein
MHWGLGSKSKGSHTHRGSRTGQSCRGKCGGQDVLYLHFASHMGRQSLIPHHIHVCAVDTVEGVAVALVAMGRWQKDF